MAPTRPDVNDRAVWLPCSNCRGPARAPARRNRRCAARIAHRMHAPPSAHRNASRRAPCRLHCAPGPEARRRTRPAPLDFCARRDERHAAEPRTQPWQIVLLSETTATREQPIHGAVSGRLFSEKHATVGEHIAVNVDLSPARCRFIHPCDVAAPASIFAPYVFFTSWLTSHSCFIPMALRQHDAIMPQLHASC